MLLCYLHFTTRIRIVHKGNKIKDHIRSRRDGNVLNGYMQKPVSERIFKIGQLNVID